MTECIIQNTSLFEKYQKYSMIPKSIFFGNIELCKKYNHIQGCIVECGVWRGGMIAAIADVLDKGRMYYLFDSFEGLPIAKEIDGQAALNWQADKMSPAYFNNCKVEINYAIEAMQISGTSNYKIIQGWFSETLQGIKFNQNIAILRLDADWYDSTMECLTYLFPNVICGGLIIIDDYFKWEGCSRAVHDYLSKHKCAEKIRQFNSDICYIEKL